MSADRLFSGAHLLRRTAQDLAEDFIIIDLGQDGHQAGICETFGINITAGAKTSNNRILLHRRQSKLRGPLSISLSGNDNSLIIGADSALRGAIHFNGSSNAAYIGGDQGILDLKLTLYEADTFIWGDRSAAFGVNVWVQGGNLVSIGEDCLFSFAVFIRPTDHHSIIDLDTGARLNPPSGLSIDDRVWIGQECLLLKGARVGRGSIIGARSLVNSEVPACEAWAGAPARCIKKNVSWVKSYPNPNETEMSELARAFGIIGWDGSLAAPS